MNETITSTFNVVFDLRNTGQKDEKFPIYARITINGKRIELSVKQMMNPLHWNERRGTVKAINDEYKRLNNYLDQLKSSYVACYREMACRKKRSLQKLLKGNFLVIPITSIRF